MNFWDSRYRTEDYVYGKEPNRFFAAALSGLAPGNLLMPGEGEGRNAVHAACQGWSVNAFDQSGVACAKANSLAAEKGVRIRYRVCDILDYPYEPGKYDAAALIFVHLPPPSRVRMHGLVSGALRPGGTLILEAFHTGQYGRHTGGPPSKEMLFDRQMLRMDFPDLELLLLEDLRVKLDEGTFHNGEAHVIRLIGRKTGKYS